MLLSLVLTDDANGIATTETSAQCKRIAGDLQFSAHIIRQVINDELVEIVMFLNGSSGSQAQSRSRPDTKIGEAAAFISASFSK